MRLFMSYLATHPEKLDPTKKQQWAKLARLDAQDMDTVCNLAYLNVAVMKQPGSQVCGRGEGELNECVWCEGEGSGEGYLDAHDMDTVCNLAYLNVAGMKQPGSQVCVLNTSWWGLIADQGPDWGWGVQGVCIEGLQKRTCLLPVGVQGVVLWPAWPPQEEGHVPQA
jgi:hypothetical protein